MNKIKVVCRAFILNKEKSLLLTKKTGSYFWSLPGGKLDESDDSIEDCLKRELIEELDLQINIKKILHAQDLLQKDTRYVEVIWEAEICSDLNVRSENILEVSGGELEDIRFFNKEEILNTDFKPEKLKEYFLNMK